MPYQGSHPARTSGSGSHGPLQEGSFCGDCTCGDTSGAEGHESLAMEFDTREFADVLPIEGQDGLLTLDLTGSLSDGTPFAACGCVKIVPEAMIHPVSAAL